MKSFQTQSFSPHFTVAEEHLNAEATDFVRIDNGAIHRMENFTTFSVREPTIHISSRLAKTTIALVLRPVVGLKPTPISGFPRQLGYEDEISCMF